MLELSAMNPTYFHFNCQHRRVPIAHLKTYSPNCLSMGIALFRKILETFIFQHQKVEYANTGDAPPQKKKKLNICPSKPPVKGGVQQQPSVHYPNHPSMNIGYRVTQAYCIQYLPFEGIFECFICSCTNSSIFLLTLLLDKPSSE